MPPLFIAAPLPHQEQPIADPASRKVWRWGRRSGKTTAEEYCAVMGHGPQQADGQPLHRGMIHGLDVVWVFRDYPQSQIIWNTELRPRFRGIDGVRLNENERTITIPAYGGQEGTLWVRSAEAIDGIKGIGKKLAGVMLDEAAQYADLEHAIKDVILPALLDNNGWLIFGSTTVAGSYFNTICTEIAAGTRSPEWKEWHRTPFDNPRLSKTAIEELIAEYPADSDALRQEVYAELIQGGAGLAFQKWSPLVHTCKPFVPPQHWKPVAALDWGINDPTVCLMGLADSERRLLIDREWMWQDKDAYDAGYDLANAWLNEPIRWPEILWVDSSMNDRTGVGGTTLYQEFSDGFYSALKGTGAPQVIIQAAVKGPGSRKAGYNQVLKMLEWGPPLDDGSLPMSRHPRMRIVKERCPYLCKTLPILTLHPVKRDDVDDRPQNRQPDHAYDALRYLLAGTWPRVEVPQQDVPQDKHPGFLVTGQRRSRDRSPEQLREEALITAAWNAQKSGKPLGGKYGRSARR